MRRLVRVLLLSSVIALPASAQETRGNISGTVRTRPASIPGATVKITNVDTKQTQQLVTNSSGYFEAPLLNPGNYQVTVEMPGFKTIDAERHRAGGRPAGEPDLHARGRRRHRAGRRDGRSAAARHQLGVVGRRTSTRSWSRPADVLEHADHAGALLVRA